MPTLPPHQLREAAESFGTDAERYDRTRPRYPDAMIQRIAAAGRDVLDVGVGTGISARQLRDAGCTVLGIDPDERMAAVARRHGIPAEPATFETWEPAGRTFDIVTAGQAWHWVDPVAGAAQAARVLRPGGRIALFWNVAEPEPGVAAAFGEVYARVAPELPGLPTGRSALDAYYAVMFGKAADGIRAAGGFTEPEQWQYRWQHVYQRDDWLDQIPTQGTHTRLPPDTLAAILAGVGAAIDANGGSFTMNYLAVTVTATTLGRPRGQVKPGGGAGS
ncbi:bifunctional 2-polyprenyl-6-hydroxyphenol methylase/3-demethylubiquinol 3-O-methyltransferase UbiG [Actinoplanes sp. N902-109]|uniref:class I SAM-dependent methyltransferase n=1 Tax=Actinoplanes sp. (strain N902-109) TaxID=649831 RepID=UPI0003296454|nr:class I SAM-dependent methyltransferase [Actinoplanes sp. N902-109]AGL18535.1 Methyltransferase type 12 [Actinoplanes sp. N902-109]